MEERKKEFRPGLYHRAIESMDNNRIYPPNIQKKAVAKKRGFAGKKVLEGILSAGILLGGVLSPYECMHRGGGLNFGDAVARDAYNQRKKEIAETRFLNNNVQNKNHENSFDEFNQWYQKRYPGYKLEKRGNKIFSVLKEKKQEKKVETRSPAMDKGLEKKNQVPEVSYYPNKLFVENIRDPRSSVIPSKGIEKITINPERRNLSEDILGENAYVEKTKTGLRIRSNLLDADIGNSLIGLKKDGSSMSMGDVSSKTIGDIRLKFNYGDSGVMFFGRRKDLDNILTGMSANFGVYSAFLAQEQNRKEELFKSGYRLGAKSGEFSIDLDGTVKRETGAPRMNTNVLKTNFNVSEGLKAKLGIILNERGEEQWENYLAGLESEPAIFLLGYDSKNKVLKSNVLVGGRIIDNLYGFASYDSHEDRLKLIFETGDWAKYEKMRTKGLFEDRLRAVGRISDEEFLHLRDVLQNDFLPGKGLGGRIGINKEGAHIVVGYGFENLALKYDSEINACDLIFRWGPFYIGKRWSAELDNYTAWVNNNRNEERKIKEDGSLYHTLRRNEGNMRFGGVRLTR
jgi:hypothetical protein